MNLRIEPFEKIKEGSKTIELRLNDEKIKKIKIGDFIEFSCIDTLERRIQTRVTALHHFNTFREMYSELPKEKLGYSLSETPNPYHMDQYYSHEKQEQYGVLGIELYITSLQKFIYAQDHGYSFGETYQTALSEMKRGYKTSHWIWYVFPQIKGLGRSETAAFFSIQNLREAKDYYDHPILGTRLIEISKILLCLESNDPKALFGYPDAYKVRSCMTLFKYAATEQELFQKVLDKFFHGVEDNKTLGILGLRGK